MGKMRFEVQGLQETRSLELDYEHIYVIGYAGRDMEKTMEHIVELEEQLGVAPPKRIPTIFESSHEQLTQEDEILFVGENTCGEVEPVILLDRGTYYVGVGSDHTDRKLESISVLKSKQVCAKPISKTLWNYEEVKDHWDQLILESTQKIGGETVIYQEGMVSDILPVEKIIEELKERVDPFNTIVIFCGTVPLKDGFKYGDQFIGRMIDPILNRTIEVDYRVRQITEEER